MKQAIKLLGAIVVAVMLHVASVRAGNLTVNGNLTVTTNAIVNGKVGVGTATPSDTLDVNGGFRVTGASTAATGSGVEIDYNVVGPRIFGYNRDTSAFLDFGIGDFTHGNGVLVKANGNVGIGTISPSTRLHVAGGSDLSVNQYGYAYGGYGEIGLDSDYNLGIDRHGIMARNNNATAPLYLNNFGGPVIIGGSTSCLNVTGDPQVGIGTSSPQALLDVYSDCQSYAQLHSGSANFGSVLELRNDASPSGNPIYLGAINFLDGTTAVQGQIACSPDGSLHFVVGYNERMGITADGITHVCVLQITGGCDVAEPFDISAKEIAKGALVIIDQNNPGHLTQSEHAYDTKVAGIVSGANGINPGLTLKQTGVVDGGEDVALSGRVYALADASYGSIQPGDLLTTSDTPGHCMKVTDHARAQGAIIGKAMSSLESGKGMVLVLVSLQ